MLLLMHNYILGFSRHWLDSKDWFSAFSGYNRNVLSSPCLPGAPMPASFLLAWPTMGKILPFICVWWTPSHPSRSRTWQSWRNSNGHWLILPLYQGCAGCFTNSIAFLPSSSQERELVPSSHSWLPAPLSHLAPGPSRSQSSTEEMTTRHVAG